MTDSLSNLRAQEGVHGNWDLANVQLQSESDPICSSAGCTQYKHPAAETHPMDYFVPDFGQDHDIDHSISNEKIASKIVGHKWDWKKADAPPPRDYKVPDFGVDEDIKNVRSAIASEEDLQGHSWNPTQDANGYWSVPEAASNDSYAYNPDQYVNNNGMVQLNSEIKSDPICSSSGCNQYKHVSSAPVHPMDYPVPDFGQDHDVADSI